MKKNNQTQTTMRNTNNASARSAVNAVASTLSAAKIEQTQFVKYHLKTGHGFGGEDINASIDSCLNRKVNCVGITNAPNGADRIVNGEPIQVKYCKNPAKTVSSAFDSRTGMYRYDGMKLEVPRDQYDECVRLMRDAISQGKVAGVTNPDMASRIVIKGHATLAQAHKVTKAGNLESIKFDVRTQIVSCAGAGAISAAISFFNAKKQGKSNTEAANIAAKASAVSSVTSLAGGVAAQQLLRTAVGRQTAAAATKAVKPIVQTAIKTQVGREVLTKTASVVAGRQVAGRTAVNVLTKAARTNAITGAVMFVATSIPDTVKLCRGKISGADYAENLASNAAGVGGGWAGASAGAAVGTAICPGVGTVIGGLVGAIGGGVAGSGISRKVTSFFRRKCS